METFHLLINILKRQMNEQLPGLEAQIRMAGIRRVINNGRMEVSDDVKKAGVLALLYPGTEKLIKLVFIQRAVYTGVHSGQISFPGGAYEEGDIDLINTALRETEEEIGVNSQSVTVVGKLTDLFIPPSNFLVTPVVGYTHCRPDFIPDPKEVSQVLEIPLNDLMNKDCVMEKEIAVFPTMKFTVPCFYVDGNVIWGATAMILNELIEVIRKGSGPHV